MTCLKSAVKAIYHDWETKIIQNSLNIKNYRLYDKYTEYLEYSKSMKSHKQYKAESRSIELFKKCFDNIYLTEFKRKHVEQFILWRKTNAQYQNTMKQGYVSNATINRDISALSSFFSWCIRMEYLNTVNPVSGMKLSEDNAIEVRLTAKQRQELVDKAYSIDRMFYYVVILLLYTGCRKNELLTLEWKEVYFDTETIIIPASKRKGNKPLVLYLVPEALNILHELHRVKIDNYVVTASYTQEVLRGHWDKLMKQIDFTNVGNGRRLTPHLLRHVFAQYLLDNGISMDDIKYFLGHGTVRTTEKNYVLFSRPDLKDKIKVVGNIVSLKEYAG